jgi:hypothetical protein
VQAQVDAGRVGGPEVLRGGHALLDAYAAWAQTVDDFTPVRVDVDFEVNIPDPAHEGADLVSPAGDAIRYTDRVDLLVIDEYDAYWAIQHRLVTDRWAEQDTLELDERTLSWCWAWPHYYLGMTVVGTVYNEIRVGASGAAVAPTGPSRIGHRRMYAQAVQVPGERLHVVHGTDNFRRTRITRGHAELARAAAQLAAEAMEATHPDVPVYPNPSPPVCGACDYRTPCLVLNRGGDPTAVLTESYRQRLAEILEEGRLGGASWSMSRGAAPPPWARPRADKRP